MSRFHGAAAARALSLALAACLPAWAQDMPPDAPETARRALHVCASCHGAAGRSTSPQYPSLAGQPAQYVVQQLRDFRSQQRSETDSRAYMWGVSALLDDPTIQALADYYAAQTPPAAVSHGTAAELARGRKLFEQGVPGTNVRACASCHGAKAEGQAGFPRLAGQQAAYLERQLVVFSTALRPHGVLMKNEVAGLSKADRRAVARYLQSL